jgi:hypothetical protein
LGTKITVYDPTTHTELYQYIVDGTNSPTVISSGDMNTGNLPFALNQIYI